MPYTSECIDLDLFELRNYDCISKASAEYTQLKRFRELFSAERYSDAFFLVDHLDSSIAAIYYKSIMLLQGIGVDKDENSGLAALERIITRIEEFTATYASSPALHYGQLAGYQLGMAFWLGCVKGHDREIAALWWIKGAKCCYPADDITFEEAAHSDRKCLGRMNACGIRCQILLGQYYASIDQWGESLFWYERAARQGSNHGATETGLLFWCGLGGEVNLSLAEHCLTSAAQNGDVCAMGILSAYHLEQEEFETAHYWARRVISYTGSTGRTISSAVSALSSMEEYHSDTERLQRSIALSFFVIDKIKESELNPS